jgi:hypothetical protein
MHPDVDFGCGASQQHGIVAFIVMLHWEIAAPARLDVLSLKTRSNGETWVSMVALQQITDIRGLQLAVPVDAVSTDVPNPEKNRR